MVNNRSNVPLVLSRSMAMLVTRNMTMNGKMPSITSATRSKTGSASSNMKYSSVSSIAGTTSNKAIVRWSWRTWWSPPTPEDEPPEATDFGHGRQMIGAYAVDGRSGTRDDEQRCRLVGTREFRAVYRPPTQVMAEGRGVDAPSPRD
ncbi:MAG TPA: hypothetical protein VI076_09230 [Actinopolymorphaceae bacterium]